MGTKRQLSRFTRQAKKIFLGITVVQAMLDIGCYKKARKEWEPVFKACRNCYGALNKLCLLR